MKQKALDYLRQCIDRAKIDSTISEMYRKHCPSLCAVDPFNLWDEIYDLLEEFGEDEDLPENWWLEYWEDQTEVFNDLA